MRIAEYKDYRRRLEALDPAELAEALVDLAETSSSALMVVKRLVSSPDDHINQFRENLAEVTEGAGRGRYGLSGEQILEILIRSLDLLEPGSMDPKIGLELTAAFFGTDGTAFESTNELDWEFESLYTFQACDVFISFALACDDKAFVLQLLEGLLSDDNYGVRSCLLKAAPSFLPEPELSTLMNR